jgi:hypothetical protein
LKRAVSASTGHKISGGAANRHSHTRSIIPAPRSVLPLYALAFASAAATV